MGPTWSPHVGPMILAIWELSGREYIQRHSIYLRVDGVYILSLIAKSAKMFSVTVDKLHTRSEAKQCKY